MYISKAVFTGGDEPVPVGRLLHVGSNSFQSSIIPAPTQRAGLQSTSIIHSQTTNVASNPHGAVGSSSTSTFALASKSTSTALDRPAVPIPTLAATGLQHEPLTIPMATALPLQAPANGLVASPDNSGLNSGAIIGVSIASLVGFLVIVTLLDILLLSNKVQSLFRRTPLGRNYSKDQKHPPQPVRANTIERKAVPPPEAPYYDNEIKHSRSLSLDSSGYSSRYSRSTWGWSEDLDRVELIRGDAMLRRSEDFSIYSISVFDDENEDEEKRKSYHGGIRIGMGVQKRYTGGSFMWDAEDVEKAMPEKREKERGRTGRTWMLLDPLEKWRKGLHPLSGKRGVGFKSISYYS